MIQIISPDILHADKFHFYESQKTTFNKKEVEKIYDLTFVKTSKDVFQSIINEAELHAHK